LVPHNEELRLRAFENGMQRKIFGLKKDIVTSDKIKLHNK
jgi:hypothetical protein